MATEVSPPAIRPHDMRFLPATLLAMIVAGCSPTDSVERLISQLDDTALREQAADQLLLRVRRLPRQQNEELRDRILFALMDAYRQDLARAHLIEVLAALEDVRAQPVFVAALGDFTRATLYYEAAVRSAQMLGRLGQRSAVPPLLAALRRARRVENAQQTTSLQRALIQALTALGDRRAIPLLAEIFSTIPVEQAIDLNKQAARALGELGGPDAVAPLVAGLQTQYYGPLLFEHVRRALCRIGPSALPALIKAAGARDRKGRYTGKMAARVVADIGDRSSAEQLLGKASLKTPTAHRLVLAETLLRLAHPQGEELTLAVLKETGVPLALQQRAVELLGWYGSPRAASVLGARLADARSPLSVVLRWTFALAYARTAAASNAARLVSSMPDRQQETAVRDMVASYNARLQVPERCGADMECYARQATDGSWRQRERAALELGRRPAANAALGLVLAQPVPQHPQVREALLVTLERLPLSNDAARAAIKWLEATAEEPGNPAAQQQPEHLRSRAMCLAWRLRRQSQTASGGRGKASVAVESLQ